MKLSIVILCALLLAGTDVSAQVLCLHGYRQDSAKFKAQTGSLRKILKNLVDFDFISAPHTVPEEGDQSRSWWFTKENSFSSRDDPETCEGLQESLKLVQEHWDGNGSYDGLLGFSQGACLVGLMAALIQRNQLEINPRFVVVFSGFKSRTRAHQDLYTVPIAIPSLHIFGETDEVIPHEWGQDLSTAFRDPVVVKHPGGHFVPGTSAMKPTYLEFFKEQISLLR